MGVGHHEQRTNARGLPAMRTLTCFGCGKRFTQARKGGRPRLTCSERCQSVWRAHKRTDRKRGNFQCACHWCGPTYLDPRRAALGLNPGEGEQ